MRQLLGDREPFDFFTVRGRGDDIWCAAKQIGIANDPSFGNPGYRTELLLSFVMAFS